MRFVLTVLMLGVCGSLYAQDANEPVSVLKHEATDTAPTPATVTETAPSAAPVVVVAQRGTCRNGRCCVGPNCRLYNVEESVSESHRHRLFGGYVTRNTNRIVYRPSRR